MRRFRQVCCALGTARREIFVRLIYEGCLLKGRSSPAFNKFPGKEEFLISEPGFELITHYGNHRPAKVKIIFNKNWKTHSSRR